MRTHHLTVGLTAGLAAIVVLLGVACSDRGSDEEAVAAPAATATTVAQSEASRPIPASASGASLSGAVSTPTPTETPDEPVSAITIVATDNAYDPADFTVRAGEAVTVTVENRGQAIHDWRIRGVTNAEGKDIGTRLLYGGETDVITITVEQSGEYAFYCEVHAVDMRGRLVVQ